MNRKQVIGKAILPSNTECKVIYSNSSDLVEVQLGGTSLRFNADSFILLNELLRKAAAKVIMQTAIVSA
ncbi:hypothetical protein [Methylotenera sp. G11]|uniref:hypothetical protein n=1 Tax=Methylotenera sp. G11 TaxID=1506585 RepID=UPI0006454B57|nr:hypothetical protein [Methylotenera sp. G11]